MVSMLSDDLVIFEMANNHQGDVAHGVRIVREMGALARKHGVRAAVKLQYRDLDSFIHPSALTGSDNKHIKRFLDTKLTDAEFRTLLAAMREEGMATIVTPFDEASVRRAEEHNIDILKVASCSVTDWPLLEAMAATGKPIICSTGGCDLDGIDNVYSFFTHRGTEFALLHCVGIYPAAPEDLNLNFIDRMRRRYPDCTIGYSGHEDPSDSEVSVIALAKGARILERHVGLPTDTVTLNAYSLSPEQVDRWLEAVASTRRKCGRTGDKPYNAAETKSMLDLARGVFARRALSQGETLRRDDVYFAFPCSEGQLSAGRFREGMAVSRDYAVDDALTEVRTVSLIEQTRTYIHRFRGMFNEAGVTLGEEADIELSHHFGMEDFARHGALLVTLVNRDFCKKLVAQLPGQTHPCHWHLNKEEVFHVLWGELDLILNGEARTLKVGEQLLVQRGDKHSFSTRTGVIVEEISSRSVRSDSHYEDGRIRALDPMVRKTVIDAW